MGKPTELTTSCIDATLNGQCRQAISIKIERRDHSFIGNAGRDESDHALPPIPSSMRTEVGLY